MTIAEWNEAMMWGLLSGIIVYNMCVFLDWRDRQ